MSKKINEIYQIYQKNLINKKNSNNFIILQKNIANFENHPEKSCDNILKLHKKINYYKLTEKDIIFNTYVDLTSEKNKINFENIKKTIEKFFGETIVKIITANFSINIAFDYYLNLYFKNNLANIFLTKDVSEIFILETLNEKKWNYSLEQIKIIKCFLKQIEKSLSFFSEQNAFIKIYDWIFCVDNKKYLVINNLKIFEKINKEFYHKNLSYKSFNYQKVINHTSKYAEK